MKSVNESLHQLTGLLRTGSNHLEFRLEVAAPGPCGRYVQGGVSRFSLIETYGPLSKATVEETILFPSMAAGTVVEARQVATNHAGLASAVQTELIMLDDSPPSQAVLSGCNQLGRHDGNGIFYQADEVRRVFAFTLAVPLKTAWFSPYVLPGT